MLADADSIVKEGQEANAGGRAATKAWPGVAVKLDSGGIGFFSQLGVVRRPDLTQYYVDGFTPNRDAPVLSARKIRNSSPRFSAASLAG